LSGKPADANRNKTPYVAVCESAANPHEQSDVAAVAVQKGGTGGEDALTGEAREQLKREIDRRTRERLEAQPDPEQLEADHRRLFAEADEIGDVAEEEIERLHERFLGWSAEDTPA
jgi:hypothetical protein